MQEVITDPDGISIAPTPNNFLSSLFPLLSLISQSIRSLSDISILCLESSLQILHKFKGCNRRADYREDILLTIKFGSPLSRIWSSLEILNDLSRSVNLDLSFEGESLLFGVLVHQIDQYFFENRDHL